MANHDNDVVVVTASFCIFNEENAKPQCTQLEIVISYVYYKWQQLLTNKNSWTTMDCLGSSREPDALGLFINVKIFAEFC